MSLSSAQPTDPASSSVEIEDREAFQHASEEISGYFKNQQVTFADYMAVIGDLRRAGQRPDTIAISRGLRELASTEGRESRRKRNENRDSKIVHLTAHATPDGENLARRVHKYESDLEEATRQIEAASSLRAEIEDLRQELAAASRRESDLAAALRAAEAKSGQEAFLQQELSRLKTLITNRDARSNFVEFVRSKSAGVSLPTETEALHREIIRLREALDEVLAMEEFFRQQWEQVSGDVECMSLLEAEITSLTAKLEEARLREQELTARLEKPDDASPSVEELHSRLTENEALLEDLRQRETAWEAEREQEAARTRETLESLRSDLEQAQFAVTEAQHREEALQNRLAELLAQPPTIVADDEESDRLAGELDAARQDLAEKDARCLALEARIDELLPTVSAYEELYQRHTQLSSRLERLPILQQSAQAARSTLSRFVPTASSPVAESPLDAIDSLAVTLEAVNAAAAQCETEFAALRDALDISRQAPAAPEAPAPVTTAPAPKFNAIPQSADLRRILVEVVEVELEKQRQASASLTAREAALRTRLETAKPRSIDARTAEEELNGHASFRNDMKQRADTLAELLRTLVASLRDASV